MRFKRECKKCGYPFRPTGKGVIICERCNPYRKGRKVELIKKRRKIFFK